MADKAVVITYDGQILADGYQVTSNGGSGGGTGESAAASIGAFGGFAVKASADCCGPTPAAINPTLTLYLGTATPASIKPVDKSGVGAAPANEVATGGAAAEPEPEPESVTVRVHLPPSITPLPG